MRPAKSVIEFHKKVKLQKKNETRDYSFKKNVTAPEMFTSKMISLQLNQYLGLVHIFLHPKCKSVVVIATSKLRFHENETTFFVILQSTKFTGDNRSL